MQEKLLKNDIIEWIKGCNYWLQYAANRLLEGENVNEALIESTYNLFKEEYKLKAIESDRTEIVFNEIPIDTNALSDNLQLQFIKEIENVNALAVGQTIQINPNLTIIYGANGTGKSGYIRLLNNAFNSRGDKQILPNVFSVTATGEPTCKFTFQSTAEPYDLTYPAQKSNIEFSQYSIFDTHSIKILLEKDNKLDFTPIGFEFFEKVLQLYESLKTKLYIEINSKRSANEYINYFLNENIIKINIMNLGSTSNEDELNSLGNYTEEDALKLADLITKKEILKALSIPEKISELKIIISQLTEFICKQQIILDCLKQDDIDHYKSLICSFQKIQELSKQEGIKSLEEYDITQIGSNEWKEFIKTSRAYASLIEINRGNNLYPSDQDKCLFCLQPLTEKENVLINSYWNLLKSKTEEELNNITRTINEVINKIKELPLAKFDESTTVFEYVNGIDQTLAAKWKEIVSTSEIVKNNIIQNLINGNFDLPMAICSNSTNEFDNVVANLNTAIADLLKKDTTKELADLEIDIQFLTDKSLLNKLLDKIKLFISDRKWAEKAENSSSAFNTKSITIKQGELFKTYITEKYVNIFNNECKMLNAPTFVNITQKNEKGFTLRKLQVAGLEANSILSEGEQKVISLSDFLTEIQMNLNNRGVFFDDPVTSQDHYRREKIAERLVTLAANKQVIIFTHDIAFFIKLKIFADEKNIPCNYTTIRKTGDIPGVISQDLPWIAQPVKQRIGTLRNRLVLLKKIEKSRNEDDYLFEVKSWYELLREGWERAVEERLFKGVVERFMLSVQTQRLKRVIITDELLESIEKGMTDSSSWIHDAAAGLNPTPPDTTKAEADLNFLDDFIKKCEPS
jgi:energy-coupling factor transporter ATP-binding protein EcfA2